MLEGSLLGIQSPIKREALRAARALEDAELVAQLGQTASSEQWSLIIIGLVATANVALGVWRPRFRSRYSIDLNIMASRFPRLRFSKNS